MKLRQREREVALMRFDFLSFFLTNQKGIANEEESE